MKKIIAFAVFAITCSFTFPPKEIQFHYVFKKGDVYEFAQASSMTQHFTVAGTEQSIELTTKVVMQLNTVEVIGTSAKFEIEYNKISLKMKLPQGDMDSDGDTTNAMNKMMKKFIVAMTGKKFNFIMAKNGKVDSVFNIENLWSGLSQDPMTTQMKPSLEQSFGKNAFKKSIETAFVFYPEQKLQAGSVWKNTSTPGMNLPLQTINSWTLESITEPNAVIVSDGVITTTDTTKVISPQPGIRTTVNMKGRQVTKITVSAVHGWPESSKSYSEITGKMVLLAGGQIPEDMDMQMEIKTESETMFKKK